jgi:hypothetical protein
VAHVRFLLGLRAGQSRRGSLIAALCLVPCSLIALPLVIV